MKNIKLVIRFSFFLILFFSNSAIASDITMTGSVRFECNLLSKYMGKHGYSFIREIRYENNIKTNLFAADDADVIVKNNDNNILGVGKTDKKGNYSISVPEGDLYQVFVRFHDREIEYVISYSDAENVIVDMGYFETGTIDAWLQMPALSYCYTCDIRYLESKGSL